MTARQRIRAAAVWNDTPRTFEDIVRDLLLDELSWQLNGLCREVDPELFFTERGDGWSAEEAVRVCGLCPVKQECLDWALSFDDNDDQYGVFGGVGPMKRRRMRRERTAEMEEAA
jgi:hypothetical protein